jgi:hypothetical protein
MRTSKGRQVRSIVRAAATSKSTKARVKKVSGAKRNSSRSQSAAPSSRRRAKPKVARPKAAKRPIASTAIPMADIREFAEQAANLYGVYQDTIGGNSELYRTQGGLPATRKTARELITAAYNASLIPDEGRYPVTCLMCYREDVAHQFHTLFDEPCESTAEEIAKLSHAIDNRSHIACICEEDRITLGGFHVNVLYNQREYWYFSGRIANPLKVRIKGPGYIEVSCTGGALVFRGGHISEESPLTLSDSMNRVVGRVTN